MVNPYMIDVADFSEGMKGLEQGFERRGQRELAKAKETKNLKMRENVFNLMKEGTPEEIEEFVVKNPGSSQVFDEVIGITNEVTKQDKVKTALKILTGEDPTKALTDHAEVIDKEGGDAANTIESVKQSAINPDSAKEGALKVLAAYAPDKLKAFKSLETDADEDKDTTAIKEWRFAQKNKGFAEWKTKQGIKKGIGKKQKTSSFLVKDPKTGSLSIATGSFNTETGKLETETASLGDLEVVSKLGETGEEETKRKVKQKESEATKKARVARDDALITRGVTAAESTATTRRALELLDLVNTGGFSKANYETRRAFGIESANEGELSNSLGKTVLSQLKETFGAAFTENEGNRLAKIEASIGKSPAANKRLLIQALRITTKTAERAKQAALRRGDEETALDIDDLLKFSLSEPENPFQNIDTTPFKGLKSGTILNTPHGKAKWDGTNLIKVGE